LAQIKDSIVTIDLSNRVAIVTGSGGGLGREHALALAARGAKLVINDLGGSLDGSGQNQSAAQKVVDEIKALGGMAIASTASVTDAPAVDLMVKQAMDAFGRIDILVNNAGILRDKSFSKMTADDFRQVLDVHLMGAFHCTKAVWEIMKAQEYGRIIHTTSSSGLFGNFGQSNYGAAKMGLVGLMQVLSIEGMKYNIKVNCLAPTAHTRMTEGLMPEAVLEQLSPDRVSPAVVFLASENAPNRTVICAGAGSFEVANLTLTRGQYLGKAPDTADRLAAHFDAIASRENDQVPLSGAVQGMIEIGNATIALGQSPQNKAK
jgi:NAD(P)-dependent dehydrogenase (short-subunit alcohol dehydrogenase family)